jgi:hypothetical protein
MLPVTSSKNTSDRLLKCGLVPCIRLLTCKGDQFSLIDGDVRHGEASDDVPVADDEARDLIIIIVTPRILRRSRGEQFREAVVVGNIGEELFQRLRIIESNGDSVKFRQALCLVSFRNREWPDGFGSLKRAPSASRISLAFIANFRSRFDPTCLIAATSDAIPMAIDMRDAWCPRPELNRDDILSRRILSPLRLPIPPRGLRGAKV